jgi:trigger factor
MDYKISIEEKSEVNRNINIEIPRELYQEQFNKRLAKTASQAKLKGFRPGRAPRAIVAKMYGDQIHNDVVGEMVSEAYHSAIKEHSINVIGMPDINIEDEDKEKALKITAAVSVYPEPVIKDYEGVSFEAEVATFSEDELEKRVDGLREQASKIETNADKTVVEDGDLVMIDYQAQLEGEEEPSEKNEGTYVEVGSGKAFKEIEDALVGAKVGDELVVDVIMPEEAEENLRGKKTSYTVTVKSICTKILPEMDDEFAKTTGLGENVEEVRNHVRKQIESEIEQRNTAAREEGLFQAIFANNTFEVPQEMVDQEIRRILLEMNILNPQDEKSYSMDVTRFREPLGEGASKRVRQNVVLQRIIEQEELSFEDDAVDAWLTEVAESEGKERSEIDKAYGFPGNTARIKDFMAMRKTIERLLDAANITEVAPAAE